MKVTKILFIILAIICCIATDCDNNNDKPTYYLDQEIKDYTLFPVGSYWVYKDSANSLIVDSVNLIWQEFNLGEISYEPFKYEFFKQNKYSLYWDSIFFCDGTAYTYDVYKTCIYKERGITHFFSQKKVGDIIYSNDLLYENYLDSLMIGQNTFYKVKIFKFINGNIENYKRIYWAYNIGIIKREFGDGTIWILEKYFINK
ncbi:MAG: hypothetical protein PHF55_00750 [Bacteroidales bacterium]|nr:hypothetical protein [Bacteroidales bacterium]MDI3479460.1 hypothetical protein [Rikenellaceae bacterium]MDI3545246.1 hypothetical protein [Rikenellaceae bacterium]MDN5355863.1 hypothetical protein [Rikenellaceae bacterium]